MLNCFNLKINIQIISNKIKLDKTVNIDVVGF